MVGHLAHLVLLLTCILLPSLGVLACSPHPGLGGCGRVRAGAGGCGRVLLQVRTLEAELLEHWGDLGEI